MVERVRMVWSGPKKANLLVLVSGEGYLEWVDHVAAHTNLLVLVSGEGYLEWVDHVAAHTNQLLLPPTNINLQGLPSLELFSCFFIIIYIFIFQQI